MEGQMLSCEEQNHLLMIANPSSYADMRQEEYNELESQSVSQIVNPENTLKLQGLASTNSKSPITQVGNVALTKGMYLALMKRREQTAFGDLNYSSTPRLRASTASAPLRQYKSCVRTLSENYDLARRKRVDWPSATTPLRQKNQQKAYQEIHKTKKIKKSSNSVKKIAEKQKQKNASPMFLADITKNCLNDTQNQSNMLTRRGKKQLLATNVRVQEKTKQSKLANEKQEERSKSVIQGNSKKENDSVIRPGISTMKARSKVISKQDKNKEKQLKQRKTSRNIASNSSDKENSNNNNSLNVSKEQLNSKENQPKSTSHNRKKHPSNGIKKFNYDSQQVLHAASQNNSNQFGLKELKYSLIWHEEAADLATEKATFIQKLRRDKKKKYSQSPKRLVPGFRVKFETSKSQIFAFNCFRDKDLEINKEFRPTIDVQQDNDFDTDSEQLKESVYNVFQSLCVAVCEEKISHQIRAQQQTQSSIY